MGTFAAGYFLDPHTGRPVASQTVQVLTYPAGTEVTPTSGPLVTGVFGGYGRFEVEGRDAVTLRSALGQEVDLVSVEKIITLDGLTDVDTTTTAPADGHILTYLVSSGQWEPRYPASHTHTASQVTDLSEAVDDRVAELIVAGTGITKTYDDAAGTLTLAASGGGGGGAWEPVPRGGWISGAWISSVSDVVVPTGLQWPMILPCPWGLDFDQVAIRVGTAEAGVNAKALVYRVNDGAPTADLVYTSPPFSLAATGDVVVASTGTLTPGQYWVAVLVDGGDGTARIRGHERITPTASVGNSFNEASVTPKTGFRINPGTYASPAASVTGSRSYTSASQASPLVGFRSVA